MCQKTLDFKPDERNLFLPETGGDQKRPYRRAVFVDRRLNTIQRIASRGKTERPCCKISQGLFFGQTFNDSRPDGALCANDALAEQISPPPRRRRRSSVPSGELP